jgi:glycerol-3-phosphate dehydrogenase (NAD(P)+)
MRNENSKKIQNVIIIGCGRWGSFIGWYLDKIGHNVTLYGLKEAESFLKLLNHRENEYIKLPDTISLTTEIEDTKDKDVVIISINSQNLRSVCKQLKEISLKDKKIVLCMKGIEIETGKRLSEIVEEIVDPSNKVLVWIGPGHIQSFYNGVPNCMVIDSRHNGVKEELINSFSSDLIRFYYGNDLIGNEIGAALKNVIGIAAGMLDGYNLTALKGALMARGTREVSRLIKALGGNELSAYGLCHLGDYEATVFSIYSHNRQFGESYVKKEEFKYLAEGYYTAKAVKLLNEKVNVELPICDAVYDILYNNKDPKETLNNLFKRSLKEEF